MFELRKTEGYAKWLDSLRDARARARVLVRTERFGSRKPGRRQARGWKVSQSCGSTTDRVTGVYYKKQGRRTVVLLAGGDKRTQSDDVKAALRLARNL